MPVQPCAGIFFIREADYSDYCPIQRGFTPCSMQKDECYKIGFIQRTHGLNGGLTAVVDGEIPEELDAVFIDDNNRLVPYLIESFSMQGSRALLRFEDITRVEEAQRLVKKSLYLPKAARPKPARGQFYDDEIIGFTMIDNELGNVGSVIAVVHAGPNKLIAIDHAGREALVPVTGPFIKSINKTKKTISVELPDGFLDI